MITEEKVSNKIKELQDMIDKLNVLDENDRFFICKYSAQREILIEILKSD